MPTRDGGLEADEDRRPARSLDLLLEPTSARAFWAATETLNFTRAGEVAGMTQSGVSQHVARIERALGVPLFRREKAGIRMTAAGHALRRFVLGVHQQAEILREQIHDEHEQLGGEVRYAMPESCLRSGHFPAILRHGRHAFPAVTLHVTMCDSNEVVTRVLDGDAHFGFVTARTKSPSVVLEPYCREEYVLLGRERRAFASPDELRQIPLVRYPGAEIPFQLWAAAQLPRSRVRLDDLPVAATINDLSGALIALCEGVGWAVLAKHCASAYLDDRRLVVSARRAAPVENQIYVASRSKETLPRRVRAVMDGFRAILTEPDEQK